MQNTASAAEEENMTEKNADGTCGSIDEQLVFDPTEQFGPFKNFRWLWETSTTKTRRE